MSDTTRKRTTIRLNANGYFASGMLVGCLIISFVIWFLLMAEPAAAATEAIVPRDRAWDLQDIVLATILAVIVVSAVAFMIIAHYVRNQEEADDER